MALGRVGTPDLAERVVAEGYGDLVGMTRAQVSDAAFANKAREGREDEIRPCIFDNFCWGQVHAGKPLAEFHNPHLGERGEADWAPSIASRARRVVVVGAGPAGLEAAWIAAARGHEVHLLGAGPAAGGKLRLEARLPGHADVARVADHQIRMAEHHGVRIVLGQCADEAMVRALDADAVVIASGARMRRPQWAWSNTVLLLSAVEFVERLGTSAAPSGRTAVLYDHDHTAPTYAVAEALADSHDEVVLMTPRTGIAQAVNYCSALGVHRRLHGLDVEIVTATEPVEVREDGVVRCRNVFSGHAAVVEEVDTLVYATPRRVDDALARRLADLSPTLIGDCLAPRNLAMAIHEGHAIGSTL